MMTHPKSQQMSRGVFNERGGSATGIGCGLGASAGLGCGIHLEMKVTACPDACKAGFDSCVYLPSLCFGKCCGITLKFLLCSSIGPSVALVGALSAGAVTFVLGYCAKSMARCLHLRKDTSENCDSHTIELNNDTMAARPPTGNESVVVPSPSATRLSEVADGFEQYCNNNANPEPSLDTNTASVSDHRDLDEVNAFWFSCAPPSFQEVFRPP